MKIDSLGLQIYFGDLYDGCKNENEVYWLKEQLESMVEVIAEERLEELGEIE